jgi:hypothetical protein
LVVGNYFRNHMLPWFLDFTLKAHIHLENAAIDIPHLGRTKWGAASQNHRCRRTFFSTLVSSRPHMCSWLICQSDCRWSISQL